MFPNPTTNFLNISTDGLGPAIRIEVYDISGKLMIQHNVEETQIQMDITTLDEGVYHVNIVDQQTGQGTVKRIIKR